MDGTFRHASVPLSFFDASPSPSIVTARVNRCSTLRTVVLAAVAAIWLVSCVLLAAIWMVSAALWTPRGTWDTASPSAGTPFGIDDDPRDPSAAAMAVPVLRLFSGAQVSTTPRRLAA